MEDLNIVWSFESVDLFRWLLSLARLIESDRLAISVWFVSDELWLSALFRTMSFSLIRFCCICCCCCECGSMVILKSIEEIAVAAIETGFESDWRFFLSELWNVPCFLSRPSISLSFSGLMLWLIELIAGSLLKTALFALLFCRFCTWVLLFLKKLRCFSDLEWFAAEDVKLTCLEESVISFSFDQKRSYLSAIFCRKNGEPYLFDSELRASRDQKFLLFLNDQQFYDDWWENMTFPLSENNSGNKGLRTLEM